MAKIKYPTTLVILFFSFFSVAQTLPNASKLGANIVPPGPNSVSLGKYGEFPVSKYTGVPSVSISFIPIETKTGFKLPIGLSYHGSGLKVNEMPGFVGVSWSLDAGGAVTRTIQGLDDFGPNGRISNPCDEEALLNTPDATDFYTLFNGAYDTQSDIMNYNFAGHSGSFSYNNKFNFKLFKKFENIDINYVYQNQSGIPGDVRANNTVEYNATDGDGNYYEFKDKELNQTNSVSGTNSTYGESASAAYLSKIRIPGDNEINFEYESFQMSNYVCSKSSSIGLGASANGWCPEPWLLPLSTTLGYATSTFKLIKKITYNNIEVEFEYENCVIKILGISHNYKRLYRVKYKAQGEIVKVYEINYGADQNQNRFWITAVKELDGNGNLFNRTTITYNNIELVPDRFSGAQDHWGYFNNNTNTSTYLCPNFITFIGSTGCTFATDYYESHPNSEYANRLPDAQKMVYGSILNIQNPLKGKTTFEFEPNTFTNNSTLSFGGGIRIKSITNTDKEVFRDKVIYEYIDGKLMSNPEYTSINVNSDCSGTASGGSYSTYYMSHSESCVPLSSAAAGGFVGYGQVNEKRVNSSGLAEYGFTSSFFYNDVPTSSIKSLGTYYSPFNMGGWEQNYYSYRPVDDVFGTNGTLIKEEIFEINTGLARKIQETNYSYNFLTYEIFNNSYFHSCPVSMPQSSLSFSSVFKRVSYNKIRPTSKITTYYFYNNGTSTSQITSEYYTYHKLLPRTITSTKQNKTTSRMYSYLNENTNDDNYCSSKPISVNGFVGGVLTEKSEYDYNVNDLLVSERNFELNNLGTAIGNIASSTNYQINNYTYNANSSIVLAENESSHSKKAFIWDDFYGKLIGVATECSQDQLAFTSFETTSKGNFIYNQNNVLLNTINSRTGKNAFPLSSTQTINFSLNKAGKYLLTFWAESTISGVNLVSTGITITNKQSLIGGVKYLQYEFEVLDNLPHTFTLNGTGIIDELKLFPQKSKFTTYTYYPFWGICSTSDENGNCSTFWYDSFGRLKYTKDTNGNVVNKINYNTRN